MSKPVASTILTLDDLLQAAAPRLLSQYPQLKLRGERWRLNIERLEDGGVRIDMIEPVMEAHDGN